MEKCLFFTKFEEIHIYDSRYICPLSGSIRLCPELDGGIETDGRDDFFLSLSLRRRKQSRIGSFRRRHRRKIQCMAIVFGLWGKARYYFPTNFSQNSMRSSYISRAIDSTIFGSSHLITLENDDHIQVFSYFHKIFQIQSLKYFSDSLFFLKLVSAKLKGIKKSIKIFTI